VHALTFSSGTGQYLLTGSQDRQIRLFNPATGKLIQTYSAHGYEVLDIAVSGNNEKFVSVGGDKVVYVWDVGTAQTVRRFHGHAGRVEGCAFGGTGGGEGGEESVVVSGSLDGTVRVWDLRASGDREIAKFDEAGDSVVSVKVLGGEIFAGSLDGKVRVYDLKMGRVSTDVMGTSVTSLTSGRNGEYLVSTLDSTVRLMDRSTGQCLQTFKNEGYKNQEYRCRSTLGMGDGVAIAGSENGRVVVWDVLSGEVLYKLWHSADGGQGRKEEGKKEKKRDVITAVAWNQARKQWASAGGNGEVVVWGMGD
jgi:mitogen-activated protein kinase organizer 1